LADLPKVRRFTKSLGRAFIIATNKPCKLRAQLGEIGRGCSPHISQNCERLVQ
jgi:hypothetical protein